MICIIEPKGSIMKEKKNEKRVVNIPKEEFDLIKKYCEDNSLDMVKWVTKNSLEKVGVEIPKDKITVTEAREIYKQARQVELPKNWLELALKDIDSSIKMTVTGCSFGDRDPTYIGWKGKVPAVNKYNINQWISLLPDQIELVRKAVIQLGFSFEKESSPYTKEDWYIIGW